MRRRLIALFATGGVFVAFLGLSSWMRGSPTVYHFPTVVGPLEKSVVAAAVPADWKKFNSGGASRMAILLTNTDSNWLELAHGLQTIGVPFTITTDYKQALKHHVVYIYPELTGRSLPTEALEAIDQFPSHGGTLIAQHALGGGLSQVIGFDEAKVVSGGRLQFQENSPVAKGLTDSEEKNIAIGGKDVEVVGTYAYTNPRHPAVATYADGSAAIVRDATGHAYALGYDLGYLLWRGYNNRQQDIAAHYVNDFEPTLDVLLRSIKNIYEAGEKDAISLATVPASKRLAVIMTHDIDYTRSLINAIEYAKYEQNQKITATYFMQVKIVRDWNDDVFFTDSGVKHVEEIKNMGMEIASHTVSHSLLFKNFPMGDGFERYPDYLPQVKSKTKTLNGTILGELRVSRFLLEHFTPGLNVASFRPGHLSDPYSLPQALVATGYRYSSSVTANDSITHLPFQLTYDREQEAETPIFEFPLTIEDEADGPMINRLPQALALAEKLKRYGGLFVILIHPDILGQKLDFEKGFVSGVGTDVWYGSMEQFGDWWAARSEITLDTEDRGSKLALTLNAPREIKDLTLNLPAGLSYVSASTGVTATQQGNQLVIDRLAGQAELLFKKNI